MPTIRQNPVGANLRRTFPSVRTVLLVRFDPGTTDNFAADDIRSETNPDPYLSARRGRQFRQLAGISESTGPKTFSSTDLRAAITAARTNLGDALARIPTDGLSRFFDVQPTKSVRRVNTYRKADELDLTFEWKSLPFDARIIRSILVLHYEGTVSADAWGSGARGSDSRPGYLVPATGSNLRFIGLADELSDAHGDGDVLSIKCRDLTSVLIDAKWPAKLEVKVAAGSTLPQVIQAILETNPAFQIFRGPFLRLEGRPPILNPARYPRIAVRARERHRAGSGKVCVIRNPPKSGGASSYWDIITDICVSHGVRPAVELDQIVLLEPRVLYKSRPEDAASGDPTFPTEYRKGIGDLSPVRRMVYGDNVAALRFNRKLGRIKAPNVEVSSRNPDAPSVRDRLITVLWPPTPVESDAEKSTANTVDPTGKPENKAHVVQLHGIIDRSQLLAVAKQVYEGMGRQELGVVIETDEISSFSDATTFDPNEDPDLLAIRAGDPIRILVASTLDSSAQLYTLSELQALVDRARRNSTGTESAVRYLTDQGWTERNARQFVRVVSSAALPDEFRVVGAAITFDGESDSGGFNIQLDCRDYVRVRADPEDLSQTRTLRGRLPGAPA